ncbi:MAG: hypothetical protein JWN41_850 [Thermoleophilia bacterium]|nr:hypothetical protein [Thermoleophilia bacterium]
MVSDGESNPGGDDLREPALERMSVEQLQGLLLAPDLTKRERRELQRAIRFHRRIETWEERHANPVPAKLHRVAISIVMMVLCLGVLVLLLRG